MEREGRGLTGRASRERMVRREGNGLMEQPKIESQREKSKRKNGKEECKTNTEIMMKREGRGLNRRVSRETLVQREGNDLMEQPRLKFVGK